MYSVSGFEVYANSVSLVDHKKMGLFVPLFLFLFSLFKHRLELQTNHQLTFLQMGIRYCRLYASFFRNSLTPSKDRVGRSEQENQGHPGFEPVPLGLRAKALPLEPPVRSADME